MFNNSNIIPKSWLAFELNVLRRLKFESVILPFTNQPQLGIYLKRWNVRVLSNDPLLSAATKAIAAIENNSEKLSEADVGLVLKDAYVPRFRLQNAALRKWFNETDAWWFDNVRQNTELLVSPIRRAIALSIGMSVGDYALSFTDDTMELRQPLSDVYRRLWHAVPEPINNNQSNVSQNQSANKFIADNYMDLMFLRIPLAHNRNQKNDVNNEFWREEWVRGNDIFWNEFNSAQSGDLGSPVETKSQYLRFIEATLRTAKHIPAWAIAHIENGFVTTQEIVEIVGRIRPVDTIFTKDFSELTGTKAIIITA